MTTLQHDWFVAAFEHYFYIYESFVIGQEGPEETHIGWHNVSFMQLCYHIEVLVERYLR